MAGAFKNIQFGEPLDSWPAELSRRSGKHNLAWLTVYSDHQCNLTWPGGRRFALDVKGRCPAGKRPALLLTNQQQIQKYELESDTEYIVVVKMDVVRSGGSAFAAYLAIASGAQPSDYEDIQLNRQLKVGDIEAWVLQDVKRLIELARVISSQVKVTEENDGTDISADDLEAIFSELLPLGPNWLAAVSSALGKNLEPRIRQVQAEATEFEELLQQEGCGEDECQDWLEAHPWILGLEYTRVRARQSATRGKMDFLLERYDGFHDLLELKGPQDKIIVEKPIEGDSTPPPSHYHLSKPVANALAQAHSYRVRLTADESAMNREHNVQNTRHPRVMIIVGRSTDLTPHGREVLEELNRSFHRVEIVPYDLVVSRARMLVKNIERYLVAREDDIQD